VCAAPFRCSLKAGAPNATRDACAVSGFRERALRGGREDARLGGAITFA
jgi:hypothetical protein